MSTLTVAGARLEVATWGPQTGPVIVLLHEGLGCVALWRDFPAALSDATGCAVLAYSRAGYGQSDPATSPRAIDYMTFEATQVLPQVLASLGQRPVILMGHSDGATIAAEYAGRVDDPRVQGIVLMAPHFFTEPLGLAEIAQARGAFDAGGLAEKMARWHRDPVATFRGWNEAWLNPDFSDWNVAEVIDHWRVPSLVIQGRQDQYGTLAQVSVCARRSPAPVQTLVLDDCRHAPHQDQPLVVLGAVARFVAPLVA